MLLSPQDEANLAPFLTLCHDLSTVYPSNPPASGDPVQLGPMTMQEWQIYLHRLQLGCRWRRHCIYKQSSATDNTAKKRKLTPDLEWRERWYCDHKGSKRDQRKPNISENKRRKSGPSIKVGCTAGFHVKKLQGRDAIMVIWYWQHTGHDPTDISSIRESQLLSSVRQWIHDRVAEGRDWNSIHDLLRVDTDIVEGLEDHSTQIPAAMAVNRMHVYNVLRRSLVKQYQLRSDCISSLQAWAKRIIADGGWANVGDVFDLKTNKVLAWYMCFATKWQRSVLQKHGKQIVCMDSTHKTCTGRKKEEDVFLYTILARSKITGRGVPLAFLLTNVSNRFPIIDLLKHLRHQEGFQPTYMIIDCSETEFAAIETAMGPQTSVIYCQWHFLKAVVKESKQKIKADSTLPPEGQAVLLKAQRNKAVNGIVEMMHAKTEEEYARLWATYQQDWASQDSWIKYVKGQWEYRQKRWAQAWRNKPHDGVDTNNYIERWHNELKHRYLKTLRQQRADYLVSLLFTTIAPRYQQQEKAVELGLLKRSYSKAEEKTKQIAREVPPSRRAAMIREQDGYLQVQSFSEDTQWYTVYLCTADDLTYSRGCTCPLSSREHRTCKHMWLIFFEKAIAPPDGIKKERVRRYEVDTDPLMLQLMQEDEDNRLQDQEQALQQGLRECKVGALKILSVISQAQRNTGKFEASQLADLSASLTEMYHVARTQYRNLAPTETQG